MSIGLMSEVRPQLNTTKKWAIVETGGAWEKTMFNKWFFEEKQMIVLYYKDFHTWNKNGFFSLVGTSCIIKILYYFCWAFLR